MNKKQKDKFRQLLVDTYPKVQESGILRIMGMLDQALTPEPKKPRAPKVRNTMTLMQWEEKQGKRLDVRHMLEWVEKNQYSIPVIHQLIEEFRIDMLSKGKEYACFRAAFQNYFNKGYLSIKPDSPRIKRSDCDITFDRRGATL
jgi:hypothetical protein